MTGKSRGIPSMDEQTCCEFDCSSCQMMVQSANPSCSPLEHDIASATMPTWQMISSACYFLVNATPHSVVHVSHDMDVKLHLFVFFFPHSAIIMAPHMLSSSFICLFFPHFAITKAPHMQWLQSARNRRFVCNPLTALYLSAKCSTSNVASF